MESPCRGEYLNSRQKLSYNGLFYISTQSKENNLNNYYMSMSFDFIEDADILEFCKLTLVLTLSLILSLSYI